MIQVTNLLVYYFQLWRNTTSTTNYKTWWTFSTKYLCIISIIINTEFTSSYYCFKM